MNNQKKKQETLRKIAQLFFRYGIKSVTMEEAASQLGISKKTLYVFFSSKNDLVDSVILHFISEQKCEIEDIAAYNLSAIDEMKKIYEATHAHIKEINPRLMFDLKKYHHNSWLKFEGFKKKFIIEKVRGNIEKGKEEKLYREEIDPNIISYIYSTRLDSLITSSLLEGNYSFPVLLRELFYYHMYGICSRKGREYLKTISINF